MYTIYKTLSICKTLLFKLSTNNEKLFPKQGENKFTIYNVWKMYGILMSIKVLKLNNIIDYIIDVHHKCKA